MKNILLAALMIALTSCSYSIEDVNVQGKEKACIQKCKRIYQLSISDESDTEFKTDILRAAKYTYEICVSTCE